jgi:hypothetical protein
VDGDASERGQQRVEQHGLAHGLRQERRDAERTSALRGELTAHRREQEDHRRAQPRVRLHPRGQRRAVHLGHPVVEEGEREGRVAVARLAHRRERGVAPVDHGGTHPEAAQALLEDAPIRRVVVHDEHRHPRQVRERVRDGGDARVEAYLAGQVEVDGRAPARLALDRQLPLHHRHELGRDREPEARAPEATRGGAVGLHEGAEEPILDLGRHADAGVGHGDREHHPPGADGRRADAHDHLAALGELDRVPDQVDQDLAEPHRIALEEAGDLRVHVANELEPLRTGVRRHRAHRLGRTCDARRGSRRGRGGGPRAC